MNIWYQIPSLDTIYANRTIYFGFKNAFTDLWHNFYAYTSDDILDEFISLNKIDIFIVSSHFYYQKFLDLKILKKYREQWMKVFVKIDFWNSPFEWIRINEAWWMKDDKKLIKQIKDWMLWDCFFHVVEQWDPRMEWFTQETWFEYITIPLAVDKTIANVAKINNAFEADISYIGTNLPEKKQFFEEQVFPLQHMYDLRLYGQDWTTKDKILWRIQRWWQYLNIPYIKSIQKPKLTLSDEFDIYKTSKICINVHENYQKKYWWDCNERTFKIPACWWFQIVDDVSCIHKYLEDWKEIVIAKNKSDRFDKIQHYLHHPHERKAISQAGMKKVLQNHTYHNRVQQILEIYNSR